MANFHETNAVSGPLNFGLLNKDELLKIVAHQRVGEILPGDWESSKPGSGYEFDGLRAFQPGDLASRIDWSALGRTGKLYVREFLAEIHYNMLLVCDLSGSMAWGRKALLADNIAASVAWSVIVSNNPCGLLLWADGPLVYLPPHSGSDSFFDLVEALAGHQPESGSSFSYDEVSSFLEGLPFRGLIFLLSDFLDPLPEGQFMIDGYEITALQLLEEVEKEMPTGLSGLLSCKNPETGVSCELDLGKWQSYNRAMQVFLQQQKEILQRAGVVSAVITPADDFILKVNDLMADKV